MASSTALSCLRSSSRRDSVLDLPPLAPAGPGSVALPGMLVTLLELLDCGESWRFLQERRDREVSWGLMETKLTLGADEALV